MHSHATGNKKLRLLVFACQLIWATSISGQKPEFYKQTCSGGEVIAKFIPQFLEDVKTTALARIEIWRCVPDNTLEFAAWEEGHQTPTFVTPTYAGNIIQMFSRRGVFFFQTARGTSDDIWVIQFESGTPRLVFQETTKGLALVSTDTDGITVSFQTLGGVLRKHHFPTK